MFVLLIWEESEGLFNNYDVSIMQDKLKLYRSPIQDCESSSQHSSNLQNLIRVELMFSVECSLFNNEYPVVKFGYQKTVHTNSNTPLKYDFSILCVCVCI